MSVTTIGLIRHGETEWNKLGRWQGHAAIPLNPEGVQQAIMLADYLSRGGLPTPEPIAPGQIAAVYASDLARATTTARIVAERLAIPLRPDVRLREIDLGEWQGLTVEEIRAWDGERFAEVYRDPHNNRRPGGENLRELGDRALAALEDYCEQHKGGAALMVSHGGLIRTLLQRIGVLQSDPIVENTSLTLITHDGERWELTAFNRIDHLGQHDTVRGGHEG